MVPTIVILLFCAFLGVSVSCFVTGISGLGAPIIFHICWLLMSLAGAPSPPVGLTKNGVAIGVVLVAVCAINNIVAGWKDVRWALVLLFLPVQTILWFVGNLILEYAPQSALEKGLGMLFVAVSAYRMNAVMRASRAVAAKKYEDTSKSYRKHIGVELTVRHTQMQLVESPSPEHRAGESEEGGEGDEEQGIGPSPLKTPAPQSDEKSPESQDSKAADELSLKHLSASAILDPDTGEASDIKSRFLKDWHSMSPATRILVFFTGIVSGILGGLFVVAAPPAMMLFSFLNLPKNEVKATWAAIGVFGTPFRILSAYIFHIWQEPDYPLYLITIPASLLGVRIGGLFTSKVNAQFLQLLLFSLIFLASIPLSDPLPTSPLNDGLFAATVAGFLIIVGTAIYCLFMSTAEKRKLAKLLQHHNRENKS